ncbi:hypothetical protein F5Y12DRAFT_712387 [Xylaria sp. FL1777]|nr:hypothetical protein F5Y12DRAFT_712387 [Xylaria sp. FL1777]
MVSTEVLVISGLGTLPCLCFLCFVQTTGYENTTKDETGAWIFWTVCAGVLGAYMTAPVLDAMAAEKPDMNLDVCVAMALWTAYSNTMHRYHTDSALVNTAQFLYYAIINTWIIAQAEYLWGPFAALGRLIPYSD